MFEGTTSCAIGNGQKGKEIMTIKQRIKQCIKSWDGEVDSIEKLVAVAYYMGKEHAARKLCNEAQDIFAEQIKRAKQCRYWRTAMNVQGNIHMIFSPNYGGDVSGIFGDDDTDF